eukprot:NODE_11_length_54881_cov_1.430718.p14 type:complete len:411 gc:universal NODE_11_length_54881_cov_1.430718:13973-15205(+)
MIMVAILICVVIFVYVVILTLKPVLKQAGGGAPVIMGLLNVVVIQIMAKIYAGISKKLNDLENYATDTQHEDALIYKRYFFKFVNTYAAVLFVGFFKEDAMPAIATNWYGVKDRDSLHCMNYSCFFELAIQLVIVLLVSQTISALTQIIIPKIKNAGVKRKAKKAGDAIKSLDYEDIDETQFTVIQRVKIQQGLGVYEFDEYEVKILQFGFVVMFGAALPIAPIFALIVNLLETRTDAIKIMAEFRRPVPVRAKDLGSWYTILSAVSTLAVVINAFLIGYQSTLFRTPDYTTWAIDQQNCVENTDGDVDADGNYPLVCQNPSADVSVDAFNGYTFARLQYRFMYIVIFEHLVLAAKVLLAAIIPDMPAVVANGLAREAYQNEKRAAGDDFEEYTLTCDDILEIRGNRKKF